MNSSSTARGFSATDPVAPAPTAVAATVKAWEHRSGASCPAVALITIARVTCATIRRGYRGGVILFFEALLLVATVAIVWFAVYVVIQLFKGQS